MNLKIELSVGGNERKMVKDTLAKEEIQEHKKSKKKDKKKKLPKEISQEILKKMFRNLLKAIGIMFYFIVLNLAYSTMKQERLLGDIEVFAGTFLVIGIIFLEKSYKKDNGSMAITGIEFLVLSLHSLSITHVITLFKYDFRFYLLTSSYVISIYYVLKAIMLYTKGRREYLSSLSDISEIVKKDEPVIKEAKKREQKEEKIEEAKQEEKKKSTKKPKKKKVVEKSDGKPTKKKSKKVTKTKSVEAKEKDTEKTKMPEKRKRGRPKKEVKKND